MAEGAVTDHGQAMHLTPGKYGVLDGALLQIVEHLVADETIVP